MIGVVPTTMIALTAPVVGLLVVVDTALTAASAVVATQAPAATVGDANDLRFSARRTATDTTSTRANGCPAPTAGIGVS